MEDKLSDKAENHNDGSWEGFDVAMNEDADLYRAI